MKYNVGWYTTPDNHVVVQITETLNRGAFTDLYAAKLAVTQFFKNKPISFEIRRLK